jgi:hypothetical protein
MSDSIDAIFILEFDRENFFRPNADTVEFNQEFPSPSNNLREARKTLIIDGVIYRPGDKFQATYMGKDERELVVFVYGEPIAGRLESMLPKLLEDGA